MSARITESSGNVIDLVSRLRQMMTPEGMQSPIGVEAADEIVRLRAEVEQLESAWTFVNIWKGRYESERALADLLAQALRGETRNHELRGEAIRALAAHEAARKEANDE